MIKKMTVGLLCLSSALLLGCGSRTTPAGITDGSALFTQPDAPAQQESHEAVSTSAQLGKPDFSSPQGKSQHLATQIPVVRTATKAVARDVPVAVLLTEKTYYFRFNSQKVQVKYLPALQAHATYLKAHPNLNIQLVGHSDPRGNVSYNQLLAKRRALAVAAQLQADGVPSNRMIVLARGSVNIKGRRVDLSYMPRPAPKPGMMQTQTTSAAKPATKVAVKTGVGSAGAHHAKAS